MELTDFSPFSKLYEALLHILYSPLSSKSVNFRMVYIWKPFPALFFSRLDIPYTNYEPLYKCK